MSTQSHTPGPWRAFTKGRTVAVLIGNEKPSRSLPCIVNWPGFDGCDLPLKQQKANARLIAASPTLLSEMERYLPVIEFLENRSDLWDEATRGTGIATANSYRHSIAKATGEEGA